MNPTHTFDIKFGLDGGEFIQGEVKFDAESVASISITESSIPLTADALKSFSKFIDVLQEFHKKFNGMKKVEFIEIEP